MEQPADSANAARTQQRHPLARFARTFIDIYLQRRTGVLHFFRGHQLLSLRFVNGEPVSARSSEEAWRLGQVLVRRGDLAAADLEGALAVALRESRLLGNVLREAGLLDRETLGEAIAQQIHEVLLTALSWRGTSHGFEPQELPLPPSEDLTLKLSAGRLVFGVARSLPMAAVEEALGDRDRVLAQAATPLARYQLVELTPGERLALSAVDGATTLRELVSAAEEPETEQRALLALIATGIVEAVETPPADQQPSGAEGLRREVEEVAAQLGHLDDSEVLGIPEGSSPDQVRAAYLRMAKRFHPDRYHTPELAGLRQPIAAIFDRVLRAYQNLSQAQSQTAVSDVVPSEPPAQEPTRRERRPPGATPRPTAPSPNDVMNALAQAEAHFTASRFWEAIQILEGMLPWVRGRSEVRVRTLLARCYRKNPKWLRSAEDELLRVLDLQPGNVEALLSLGEIYRQVGMPSRARAMFERVLEIEPAHSVAWEQLGERPDQRKGVLARFLGHRSAERVA
jgi:hypothetical protein